MKGRALVLGLAVLASACGGAGGSAGTGGAAATTQPTTAPTATPAPTAAATTAAPSGPALASLLTAARTAEYKITYRITATGQGSSFSGDQTWYFKPPRSRFDFSTDMGGQRTTIQIFNLPDGAFMCFAAGGTAQCLGAPATGSPADQNSAIVLQRSLVDRPDQWSGAYAGARTIAGQQGHCYEIRGSTPASAGLTQGRFCYTSSGIPLSSQFSVQGGDWTMEATSVSLSVPDTDFTLPAPPTRLP